MDLIVNEFKMKAIIRGGIYLYKPVDAIAVIRRCNQLKSKVLGIDSFIVTDKITQPVSEHSIDFTTGGISKGNWMKAELFIKEKERSGLLFEIVYE